MIDWIAPALISPFLFSIVTLLDKRVLSGFGIPVRSFNLFVGASQGSFGLVIIIANPLSGVDAITVLGGLSIGVLHALGLILMFWMLSREDPSRVVPAMQTSPIFVALLAWPIFDEPLGAVQWAAVLLAVSGAMLVSVSLGGAGGRPGFRPIFLILVLSALMLAGAQLLTKATTDELSAIHTVALRGLGLFATMWLIFARPNSLRGLGRFLRDPRRAPWLIVAEGILPFIGNLLIIVAISRGPVALVASLFGTRPIWVFIGSVVMSRLAPAFIYEEFPRPDLLLKLLSASLVVVAIVLISTS